MPGGPASLDVGVPRSEGLLGAAEQGGFLQKRGAIAAELGNCGAEFGIV